MPLQTDYRPREWKEFLGNKALVVSLRSVLEGPDPTHTYLFSGPKGCGKTTLARLAAKTLEIADRNVIELDCGTNNKVEDARNIVSQSKYAPLLKKGEKGRKAYILDECHMLTKPNAQTALLKTLEEPPEHTFFFLCSTDPNQLLPTVRDRCMEFQVAPLSRVETADLLLWVLKEAQIEIDEKVLRKICEISEGTPRTALVLLGQVIDIENPEIALDSLIAGIKEIEAIEIVKILIDPNIKDKWPKIVKILNSLKAAEYEQLRLGIFSYLMSMLKSKPNSRIAEIISYFMDELRRPYKGQFELMCYLASGV